MYRVILSSFFGIPAEFLRNRWQYYSIHLQKIHCILSVCGCFCFMTLVSCKTCNFFTLLCILFIFLHYGPFCAFCCLQSRNYNAICLFLGFFGAFWDSLVRLSAHMCISDSPLYYNYLNNLSCGLVTRELQKFSKNYYFQILRSVFCHHVIE